MRDFQEQTRYTHDSKIFKRLLDYARPYQMNFIVALLLILVDVALSSVAPMILGFIVRITGTDVYSNGEKTLIIIGIIGLFILSMAVVIVTTYYQQILLQTAGQKIVREIRGEVFVHIEKLSLGQIYKIPIGKLVTRVTNDTNTLSEMYTSVIVNLIRNIMLMIVQFIIMLVLSIKAALMMGITIPFVAIFTFMYRKLARNQYRKVRNENANVNAYLQENLSGIKLTQIFNQEEKKQGEFTLNSKKLRNEHLKELLMFAIYRPSMSLLSTMASLIVIYYMGSHIVSLLGAGQITSQDMLLALVGSLVMLYTYANSFFQPLQNLSEDFNVLQSAFASAEKVFDVLDTKPEIEDDPEAIELVNFKGEIEFKNVWFYYVEECGF